MTERESKTVLLVDDEEGILLAYLGSLQAAFGPALPGLGDVRAFDGSKDFEGYRFLLANSGEEAVAVVLSEREAGRRVACGFFDLAMPNGIDGVETIRRIRALDPDVLCTVVTAHVGDCVTQLQQVFTQAHVDEWDYMAKPFSRWEIVQKCRQMVGSWTRRRREENHLAEIERLNRELAAWGSSLERRVAERTAELASSNREVRRQNEELEAVLEQLSATQARLVQQETMASIGQLATGVAQELGGPLEFVQRNLDVLGGFGDGLVAFADRLSQQARFTPAVADALRSAQHGLSVDYVLGALPEVLGQSSAAVERIGNVLSSLRAFSRLGIAEKTSQDVNATLAAAIESLSEPHGADGQVIVDFGELEPVAVDGPAMQQAWTNILVNAMQAGSWRSDGPIVRVTTRMEDGEALVEIADAGCGMSPDVAARAFEPFFTTHESGRAVGLGLSVVHGIVRQHGGDVAIESAPGVGTRVTVRLPVAADAGENSN